MENGVSFPQCFKRGNPVGEVKNATIPTPGCPMKNFLPAAGMAGMTLSHTQNLENC